MLWNRKKSKPADEEFLDLKETVWHLQITASSLNETTQELRQNVERLRDMNRASPNYQLNKEKLEVRWKK